MDNYYYILDENGDPKVVEDILEWGEWFETADRIAALDEMNGIRVSTVFLGLNHNFGQGLPLLWETMIFGGDHEGYQDRYSTLDEAKEGHQRAVRLILGKSKES